MATSEWKFYEMFREYVADGTIDLDGAIFRISLYKSASDVATVTQSRRNELSGELADANGYSTSGKTLSATTWTTGASAKARKFDSTAVIWTASGGALSNVRYAVVWVSGASAGVEYLIMYSALSTGKFDVTTGNTITITPHADGIFTLTGG